VGESKTERLSQLEAASERIYGEVASKATV
jgi:hypothetical protein